MPMICPECQQNLDDVPVGDPCPRCGGDRRSAVAYAEAAIAAASVLAPTIQIGYSVAPGWTHQWRTIQRHLVRLREQYQGIGMHGNLDLEDTVDALFIALFHLNDWLHQDDAVLLDEDAVKAWVGRHMSLALSRDFANTRKHMKRDKASAVVAQIRQIETGPNGQKATIEYWPGSQPGSAKGIDALVLAEQCERDWRALLAAKGIQVPSL